jgi:GNAT superfamily N-acetyltransferase
MPKPKLRISWFEGWDVELDDALRELPQLRGCPHELYRLLAMAPAQTPKRTALVADDDGIVAVVALRQKDRHWEPVTQGIIPRAIAPCRDGDAVAALAMINVDARVQYWPQLPEHPSVRAGVPHDVYRIRTDDDFEKYWRASGHLSTVKNVRRHTKDFTLAVDRPGDARWTIASWAERWRDDPQQEAVVAGDLLLAAEYLEPRGKHHTFVLRDGEAPVAGYTFMVEANDIVFSRTHFDPAYAKHGVGTRTLDLVYDWAAKSTYDWIDLGGAHGYKERWAPRAGQRWDFSVCPAHLHAAKRAARIARQALSAAASLPKLLPLRRQPA